MITSWIQDPTCYLKNYGIQGLVNILVHLQTKIFSTSKLIRPLD